MPLRERQSPHARLREALRLIARELVEGPPGMWHAPAEREARALCAIIASRADRPHARQSVLLLAQFERRFASVLLKLAREEELERLRWQRGRRA